MISNPHFLGNNFSRILNAKLAILIISLMLMTDHIVRGEDTRQTSHGVLALLNPGNLIRNPDYEFGTPGDFKTLKDWRLSPPNGWVFDKRKCGTRYWYTFFLCRDADAELKQKDIPLEKNHWYRVETLYQTPSSKPIKTGKVGWMRLKSANNNTGDLKNFSYLLGPAEKWVTAVSYYYNGDGTTADYSIRLYVPGSKAYIGKVVVKKPEESDFNRQILIDPGLECSHVGNTSADWGAYTAGFPVIASIPGAPKGKTCLELPLPATAKAHNNRMILRQNFLARNGDTLKIDFWAKADTDVFSELYIRTKVGKYTYRKTPRFFIKSEWKKYSYSFLLQPGDSGGQGGDNLFKKYPELLYDFQMLFKTNSGKAGRVWFNDFSIEIVGRKTDENQNLSKFAKDLPRSRTANLLLNGSFEAGMAGWGSNVMNIPRDFEWQKRPFPNCYVDVKTAAIGKCSLKLENIYHGNTVNTGYFPVSAMNGKKYTFSVWVKSDKACSIAPLIGDYYGEKEGKTFSLSLSYSTPGKWKRLSGSMTWKGYKADFAQLKLRIHAKKLGDQLTVWLDGAQFQEGGLTDYQSSFGDFEVGTDVTGGILQSFEKNVRGEARVYIRNNLPERKKFKLVKLVRNRYNTVIERGKENIVEVPGNDTIVMPVSVDTSRSGSFIINYQLTDLKTGLSIRSLDESYAVFPILEDIPADESLIGFFSQWTACGHDPLGIHRVRANGDADSRFKIFQMSKCHQLGGYLLGAFIAFYPQKEKFQVPKIFDWYLNKVSEYGIQLSVSLGVTAYDWGDHAISNFPEWSRSKRQVPPQAVHNGDVVYYPKLECWRSFVRDHITHFKGKIQVYGCFAERGCLDPVGIIDYYKILREEAQKIDPAIKIEGPSLPGYTFPTGKNNWIDQAFKSGLARFIDIYAYHGYGINVPKDTPYGPDDVWIAEYPQWFFSHYGRKPMWDTEWWIGCSRQLDWATFPFQVNGTYNTRGDLYATRAAAIVRHCVMEWSVGTKMFLYFAPWFNEIGNRALITLTNCRQVPLPGWIAYTIVCNKLGRSKFLKKIRLGDTLIYIYEKNGKPNAVYWNFKAGENTKIAVKLDPEGLTVDDIMKNPIPPTRTTEGTVLLPLSMDAVYVTSDRMKMADFISAFENAEVKGLDLPPELRMTLARSADGKPVVVAVIKNSSSKAIKGILKINEFPKEWRLGKNTMKTVILPSQKKIVSIPVKIAPCTGEALEASLCQSEKVIAKDYKPVSLCIAMKTAKTIKLDGHITATEYGDVPAFSLNLPSQVGYFKDGTSTKRSNWAGEKDVSVKCRAVWDSDNIYLGIEVKDDMVCPAESKTVYAGDCLELYFNSDPVNDIFREAYTRYIGKFYLGVTNSNGPAKISWRGKLGGLLPNNVKAVSYKTPEGYNLEIRIPVSSKLADGDVWGFDSKIIDFDTGKKDVLDKSGYKSHLTWSGGRHLPERNKKLFGFLVFRE